MILYDRGFSVSGDPLGKETALMWREAEGQGAPSSMA